MSEQDLFDMCRRLSRTMGWLRSHISSKMPDADLNTRQYMKVVEYFDTLVAETENCLEKVKSTRNTTTERLVAVKKEWNAVVDAKTEDAGQVLTDGVSALEEAKDKLRSEQKALEEQQTAVSTREIELESARQAVQEQEKLSEQKLHDATARSTEANRLRTDVETALKKQVEAKEDDTVLRSQLEQGLQNAKAAQEDSDCEKEKAEQTRASLEKEIQALASVHTSLQEEQEKNCGIQASSAMEREQEVASKLASATAQEQEAASKVTSATTQEQDASMKLSLVIAQADETKSTLAAV
ncbi:hypothetical protein VMCG_09486 [Cytospora schulzeri]|uniref:Uncharacterized protein n=1 Tax=Cytospora schulzeri TaxID=448051 RepID=A0A423VFN5_9PEZI|nr:hypothetical protein VMCG_09486 [Valsa malicola]